MLRHRWPSRAVVAALAVYCLSLAPSPAGASASGSMGGSVPRVQPPWLPAWHAMARASGATRTHATVYTGFSKT